MSLHGSDFNMRLVLFDNIDIYTFFQGRKKWASKITESATSQPCLNLSNRPKIPFTSDKWSSIVTLQMELPLCLSHKWHKLSPPASEAQNSVAAQAGSCIPRTTVLSRNMSSRTWSGNSPCLHQGSPIEAKFPEWTDKAVLRREWMKLASSRIDWWTVEVLEMDIV